MSDGADSTTADTTTADTTTADTSTATTADATTTEPSWQSKFLSPELAANPALANYGSIEDAAKGLVETKEWARGRVAIPKADDAAGFAEFAAKVRPAKAEDYTIPVPEGQGSETADAYRAFAFEIGAHPIQAQRTAEWFNQHAADTISRMKQESQNGLIAYEAEIGSPAYHQRLVAIENMLKTNGMEIADLVPALEQIGGGAGPAVRLLAALAEKTGELAKVDSTATSLSMGTMTKESAQQQLDAMALNKDADFQKRLTDPASAEYKQRKALMTVLAKK